MVQHVQMMLIWVCFKVIVVLKGKLLCGPLVSI